MLLKQSLKDVMLTRDHAIARLPHSQLSACALTADDITIAIRLVIYSHTTMKTVLLLLLLLSYQYCDDYSYQRYSCDSRERQETAAKPRHGIDVSLKLLG